MRGASPIIRPMEPLPHAELRASVLVPWLVIGLAGVMAPASAILLFAGTPAFSWTVGGPILAVALMSVGMIGAAAAGRLWIGVALSLLTGGGLLLLAWATGSAPEVHLLSGAVAIVIASLSFAARGALFARSAADKGWWIAIAVVSGEAAMLATAAGMPDSLPDWLLALLPAQWASTAIQTALAGTGLRAALPELLALAGTAMATLLVARLWPRRWPYLIMFTAWLALSALVLAGA